MIAGPDYPSGVPDRALDRWGEVLRRDWGGPVGLGVWAPTMKGDAEFAEWWARLLRQGTSPAGAIALIDLYREIDVRGVLPSISAPTLVMHRSGDRLVLVDQARYLAEHIPGARYVELPGEDHLPWVGDQDAIIDEIEEFLPAAIAAGSPNGRWRPSSSPTSSARPRRRPSSATSAGATCSNDTTRSSAASSDPPRPRGEDDGRRVPRHLRRPGAGDPLRRRRP